MALPASQARSQTQTCRHQPRPGERVRRRDRRGGLALAGHPQVERADVHLHQFVDGADRRRSGRPRPRTSATAQTARTAARPRWWRARRGVIGRQPASAARSGSRLRRRSLRRSGRSCRASWNKAPIALIAAKNPVCACSNSASSRSGVTRSDDHDGDERRSARPGRHQHQPVCLQRWPEGRDARPVGPCPARTGRPPRTSRPGSSPAPARSRSACSRMPSTTSVPTWSSDSTRSRSIQPFGERPGAPRHQQPGHELHVPARAEDAPGLNTLPTSASSATKIATIAHQRPSNQAHASPGVRHHPAARPARTVRPAARPTAPARAGGDGDPDPAEQQADDGESSITSTATSHGRRSSASAVMTSRSRPRSNQATPSGGSACRRPQYTIATGSPRRRIGSSSASSGRPGSASRPRWSCRPAAPERRGQHALDRAALGRADDGQRLQDLAKLIQAGVSGQRRSGRPRRRSAPLSRRARSRALASEAAAVTARSKSASR